ncbi:patatin-like phospholipase family protein [Pasteurella skyensis]|uniref:Patatin-like phospholipase family protein n=1 Tax=Phocoenobacter skyensis TaxID=97481 RepID=A0AAJ6NZY9_9PAST|nr:patatin-like phospholipase family protein [Pasteurella skyensis]MDP8161968.1 patatin-like phospholipase family protein [Pasteurella skyensis]MDP8170404.1 patatin-like phospholipase family protein [Pasteurella skyensis]MDP8172124.1 patatin-like phospholipase family protein [Pasteurella skyensis]MDP8175061.1 patatin-like phospholipase family protein [Pasteurella skyensis]MDP8176528.1 patatin-like phospholipase family protein [Pasteurella skyensis]
MKRATLLTLLAVSLLSACSSIKYQPIETIKQVDINSGYRVYDVLSKNKTRKNLIILMFSGGGNRAASLGYGVLEQFAKTPIHPTAKGDTLLENIDLVYGVSGGAVLASYFALEGKDVIPKFENKFLSRNFQKEIVNRVFSFSNMWRLSSPQFGRGDLLKEQLNLALFKGKTFNDLLHYRKGPFAVISATDMNIGQRINFTQEDFDHLCLNLEKVEIAKAVAASSSVPLIFTPLTFNNNGGNCHYNPSAQLVNFGGHLKNKSILKSKIDPYKNSQQRPFIHLVDGGLTDNLGLRSLLDLYDLLGEKGIEYRLKQTHLKNIIVININAQNQISNEVDKSADIPSTVDIVNSVIKVPIDNNSHNTLLSFRNMIDEWNKKSKNTIKIHFASLNLKDLPPSQLRDDVLNISTSLYLPTAEVNNLKKAATILLNQSAEYQQILTLLQH